ncbi:MAG: ABC transporter permease [Jatrophihabitantaceae bacterium]
MTGRRRGRRRNVDAPPALVIAPALIGIVFLVLPTLGLLIRAPWSSLGAIYADTEVADALRISLVTSLQATVLSLLFGVPLALVLARQRLAGIGIVRALVLIPMVLPPVVGGVALFLALGREGFVGRYLDQWFGFTLPFTQHGIVLAQTLVAMPFMVITMEGAFRTADRGLEEAAATLGASRSRIFTRVTLPLVVPSLVAGTVLCWARALGEFGATVIFGGNVPGSTQTMPTAIFTAFQTDPQNAVALSLPLLIVAVVILGALRDKWLRPVASS